MNVSWAAITDCELCKYTGGGNDEMMNILSYMIDSTGAVHEDEICRQVVEACGAMQPPVVVEKEAVRIHLHEHMLEHDGQQHKDSCIPASRYTGQRGEWADGILRGNKMGLLWT